MKISIIGFGDFGRLTAKHLAPLCDVLVYSRDPNKTKDIELLGAKSVSLQEATDVDVIIMAVNLNAFEPVLREIAPNLNPGTLVVDVTSVKLKPVEIMKELVPESCQILATHPLFGPQTANDDLAGHKIVIDPIRVNNIDAIEKFLTDLGLEIVRMTADDHDREMAWVHALTFFVGRGLLNINPPKSVLETNYYKELLDVVDVERQQSLELFYTIQRGNPYAEEMRQKLIGSLTDLEKQING